MQVQGRIVGPLVLSLVSLSACGYSGSDSPNDVSEPAIDERFAVDADGRQLALLCNGEGSPTVFLEPGDDSSGDEFTFMMRPLGERTTTCTYDRLGLGRSDPLTRLVVRWTMRPPTYTLSSRPPTCQSRSFTWARLEADTSRSTTRPATPTTSRESSNSTSRRTIPRKERRSFRARKRGGTRNTSTTSTPPVE
jgi:hypothetical protein